MDTTSSLHATTSAENQPQLQPSSSNDADCRNILGELVNAPRVPKQKKNQEQQPDANDTCYDEKCKFRHELGDHDLGDHVCYKCGDWKRHSFCKPVNYC